MSVHNIQRELETASFTTSGRAINTPEGYVIGWGTTVGNGVEGWAPGAIFVHTDGADEDTILYKNAGTNTTASFVASYTTT